MRAVNPNLYGASWYGATQIAAPPRDPLTTELDVDVCVVGAGLAGLTVAREVARRGWSVVVLESHSVAWNASGRNTGFVLPGFAADPEALVRRVGRDHARALWALSEAGAEYVRTAAQEPSMQGVALTEEILAAADAVVVVTDHKAVDYQFVMDNASLIVDSRNVTKGLVKTKARVVSLSEVRNS